MQPAKSSFWGIVIGLNFILCIIISCRKYSGFARFKPGIKNKLLILMAKEDKVQLPFQLAQGVMLVWGTKMKTRHLQIYGNLILYIVVQLKKQIFQVLLDLSLQVLYRQ